jgi:uncharacterized delta-60 repeat protein
MPMNPQRPGRWMWSAVLASMVACASCTDPAVKPDPDPDPQPSPAKFSLELSRDKVPVLQGSNASLNVTVRRESGFEGAVSVSLTGLPPGVTAPAVSIASGATTAELRLEATASAAHSLPTTVSARGTSGDQSASKDFTVTVHGPAGSLDTSFGGAVTTAIGAGEDYAEAMAVQADGKILVAGRTRAGAGDDIALVRYMRDGSLDTGFGTGGKVSTAIGGQSEAAYAIAVQGDGKIIVAGFTDVGPSNSDFALVRYNADGSKDTTFGTDGVVITAVGPGADRINAIVLQPDGKIVVGGDTNTASTGLDFALARYGTDGRLDTSFDGDGLVVTPIQAGTSRDSIYALALQDVGGEKRIVAAGGETDFVLARYTASGALDTTFGTGGKLIDLFGSTTIGSIEAAVVNAAGQLIVGGHLNNDLVLARLTESGGLDSGFGTTGRVTTPLSATDWDRATAMVLQEDGKLVVGGWAGTSSSADFALVRYETSGALDTGFGSGGKVVMPIGTGLRHDEAQAVALQADERVPAVRIVLAGSTNASSGHDFAVARYWP